MFSLYLFSIESVDSTSGLDQLEEFMNNAERPQTTPTNVGGRVATADRDRGSARSQPRPGSATGGRRSAARRGVGSNIGINDAQYLQQLIAKGVSCSSLVLKAISNTVPAAVVTPAESNEAVSEQQARSLKADEGEWRPMLGA